MWFRRRRLEPLPHPGPTPEQQLLANFLTLETERVQRRSELEAKRDELEVKKLEIEIGALAARTKAQIELEAARAELRAKKRELGRRGMQKRRAMERPGALGCPLCADPNFRDVTIPIIEAHRMHEAMRENRPSEHVPEGQVFDLSNPGTIRPQGAPVPERGN